MTRYDARAGARAAAFSPINPGFNGAALVTGLVIDGGLVTGVRARIGGAAA